MRSMIGGFLYLCMRIQSIHKFKEIAGLFFRIVVHEDVLKTIIQKVSFVHRLW